MCLGNFWFVEELAERLLSTSNIDQTCSIFFRNSRWSHLSMANPFTLQPLNRVPEQSNPFHSRGIFSIISTTMSFQSESATNASFNQPTHTTFPFSPATTNYESHRQAFAIIRVKKSIQLMLKFISPVKWLYKATKHEERKNYFKEFLLFGHEYALKHVSLSHP